MKPHLLNTVILPLLALIAATLVLVIIADRNILTLHFYERNGEPFSGIPDLESLMYRNVENVIYVYAIIYLVIKVLLISTVLATGLFFFDIKLSFRALLRVVVLCEFIFLVPAAAKICWFWQDRHIVDLESWQHFYFLSAASMFPDAGPAFLLPLQTFNIFEVTYWFLLAGGIKKIAAVKFDTALKVVLVSYVPALFVWIILVVYVTVVYFPQSF